MDIDSATETFRAMLEQSQAEGVPHEIRLTARPVVDAEYPGETVPVVDNPQMPEGTNPAEPDALALEMHVSGPHGAPLGAGMLGLATEHGLRVGTSDLLLLGPEKPERPVKP